ncbi:TPA: DNA-directed RNA polymerase subunit beta [Candidatus Dependentiae bacterium]|nr:MAG: DNA-directed RNA polymerase subunit beta [candidate division TM6 bacterium GW2011_GWE2_31_21]KKP54048.1 MAG: DNA-directed RNA polymerase subunit beta [candidate division TM6 bacterium GW2011_GWF2_33_332]HBS48369.1 DNA-directed RNA polymerase subunit beta [Candidatus Dependentiae bacterium]HBZ72957.1 DNA-directed RNA polymerase subunit beta [Candidatus Dependentiae bacterium]
MSHFRRGKGVLRRSFGKIKDVVSLPNLIEVQSKSFNDFVQLDFLPSERKSVGLEKILKDIFPIEHEDSISLEYVSYELGDWACSCGQLTGLANRYHWSCSNCKKSGYDRLNSLNECPNCKEKTANYVPCKKCLSRVSVALSTTADECRYSGKTYSLPLKIKVQLVSWDKDPKTEKKIVKDIKEQEVFFGDLPMMVDIYEGDHKRLYLGSCGTFLINGVDRVIVSQIHRSPGVVFVLSKKSKDFRGNPYHMARIIPARGSWLDFEFDHNDILYVKIDKKRKILVTTFLQALGVERNDILPLFYSFENLYVENGEFLKKVDSTIVGQRLEAGVLPKNVEKDFIIGKRISTEDLKKLQKHKIQSFSIRKSSLLNRVVGEDIVNPNTGEVIVEQGRALTEELLTELAFHDGLSIKVIQSSGYVFQPTIATTLAEDDIFSKEDSVKEIYYKLRPGDSAEPAVMEEYIKNLFFNARFYDLSKLGRIRTNRKLGLSVDENISTLTMEDVIATLRYLVNLKERGEGDLDDIDHLGNRCVRLVGELLQSQMYIGYARIEKIVKERFRLQEHNAVLMPYDFLNVKPLAAVLKEFFGTGQLSQFMDQTNPLSEIAHKRRLSAFGPGGITRERATFEVRDVHTSHYGRICPIETPEGQNIGLISSLATYARVNELGFIETTYRPVENKEVKEEVIYMDAFNEQDEIIAQATVKTDKKGHMLEDKVLARKNGNIIEVDSSQVSYVDASPKQLVSVPTSLIPFLEHDDANRALMGSNMQRQAVPLIKCQPPIVGTGMERELGALEGAVITTRHPGIVKYVTADTIIITRDKESYNPDEWFSNPLDVYSLKKYARSNHCTWIHQTPIVKVGDIVKKGDVLTNGAAVANGELALGSNVLVAFMPWQGYNFEDAIVLSKRLVSEDVFSSVHVEEFTVEARDTKLGPEEITCDIPNVSEKALESLDEDGIVKIGTRVKPGGILVGKVTLKGDIQYSPEEKLLRAIFGEKSREVRDTSLRVPPGIEGTVINVKVFSRSGARKDKRYKRIVELETEKVEKIFAQHISVLSEEAKNKIISMLDGKKSNKKLEKYATSGSFDKKKLSSLTLDELFALEISDEKVLSVIKDLKEIIKNQTLVLMSQKELQISRLKKGDDLPSGVIKMIRVYIAMRRPVSVGDKMAGRHGNKGVVSRIVDIEDMPYMEDGTPVDIVLNPLGVPSRMNIGQILETILGMAGKVLGKKLSSMIEEKSYEEVKSYVANWYGENLIKDIEKKYGKESIYDIARESAQLGMAVTTPIFDGADFNKDIQPLLKEANLSDQGICTLYDGRTGDAFDQPVTVGFIYMMKLNHLADDKLHARSVGPYSLITQQPLGGKAQFGGQRLGEMEVWALFGYGAAYTLQEMLTVKSDDVNGRVKVYESIVRGEDIPEPGIPESFNVLVKELQSLALQVDLFKASKEQIGE